MRDGGITPDKSIWSVTDTKDGLKTIGEMFAEEGIEMGSGAKGGDLAW